MKIMNIQQQVEHDRQQYQSTGIITDLLKNTWLIEGYTTITLRYSDILAANFLEQVKDYCLTYPNHQIAEQLILEIDRILISRM